MTSHEEPDDKVYGKDPLVNNKSQEKNTFQMKKTQKAGEVNGKGPIYKGSERHNRCQEHKKTNKFWEEYNGRITKSPKKILKVTSGIFENNPQALEPQQETKK